MNDKYMILKIILNNAIENKKIKILCKFYAIKSKKTWKFFF